MANNILQLNRFVSPGPPGPYGCLIPLLAALYQLIFRRRRDADEDEADNGA